MQAFKEDTMLRKTLIALAATAALSMGVATDASARGMHMHGHVGGWGGWHGHHHGGFFRGPRFFAGPFLSYGYYDPCYRPVRVWTPWGWRFRRVWVCG
jgi:hypothetical protein